MAKLAFVITATAATALILAIWTSQQVRAQDQCVFDATQEGYPGDCAGGRAQYELAYNDDNGCQTVLVNLENTTQHPSVQSAAAALGSLFTRWQAQLEASRPPLAP